MVNNKTINMQLAAIDADVPFWLKPEIKQLPKLLVPDENIRHAISGRYEGGTALLCATDIRLLIVDKKPMFLNVEDVRYDMIAEVNYTHQVFYGSIHLLAFNKDFAFTSFNKDDLHKVTEYIQHKLSEVRQMSQQVEPRLMEGVINSYKPSDRVISQDQAREVLPNTSQAWDRVTDKLDSINGIADNTSLITRRRITKFDTFQ